jgi:hypothetical protein
MYSFKKAYGFAIKNSFLSNPRGFAYWLYRSYKRIKAAYENNEVSFKDFRLEVLDIIDDAESLPGRDRFICDLYNYRNKAQIFERCEIAIEKARGLYVSRSCT